MRREAVERRKCSLLFFLCWIAYFSTYIGRQNYMAVNLLMGVLVSPDTMIAAWCVNGFAQSMTWSPLLRIFAEYLPKERQRAALWLTGFKRLKPYLSKPPFT